MISFCLSDVTVRVWEDLGTNGSQFLQHWRRNLWRSSLLYNTETLIFPSLCATAWKKGKCRSSFHFFSDLLLFSHPAPHFLSHILHYFLILTITSLFFHDVFLFSPSFFCLLLIFPSLSTAVLSAKCHPLLLLVDWLRREPEDENTFQGRHRNPGISQSVKKKLQQCKISSVLSIKSPKAIPRARRKEGSHDNWRLNSIRCLLLMSLFPIPEWN